MHEYAATLAPRYRSARTGEKGRIVDEFCRTTGMHRKAAIRLLKWAGPGTPSQAVRAAAAVRRKARLFQARDDLTMASAHGNRDP